MHIHKQNSTYTAISCWLEPFGTSSKRNAVVCWLSDNCSGSTWSCFPRNPQEKGGKKTAVLTPSFSVEQNSYNS